MDSKLNHKRKQKKTSDFKQQVQKQKLAHQFYNDGLQLMNKFRNGQKRRQDAQAAIQKFSQAITCLQSAPASDKGSTHAKYHADRGSAFMAVGHYQKAMYDFGTAIRFDDKNAQYYANRGNCMMMLNQINDALAEFQKAITLKPTQGNYYFNRGLVHARLLNHIAAIQDFTDGIKYIKNIQKNSGSQNNYFKAFFHRGNCYRMRKQYLKSISDLTKACQLVKDDAPAQNNLGLSYFQNQQFDLALQRFKKAIQLDSSKATYYNNKALALYHNQQYQQSLIEYNKALSLDPNDARTLFNRGNTYLALQKIQQAHLDFDQAINIMPTNAKFYHSKGLAYQDMKKYPQAIQMFKTALNVSNDHIPSLYHLALMQHKNNQLSQALQSLTIVLKKIGPDRLVYQSRGIVYQDIKNHKKAIQDFNNGAQIQPTYAEIYFLRGVSKKQLAKLNQMTFQQAIQDFMLAEQFGSKNAGIYKGIGQCHRHLKQSQKALYYLNLALSKQQKNPQFLLQRSNIYVSTKNYKLAIDDLTTALNISHQARLLYKRGLAFYLNKQFKKAIKDLTQSIQLKAFEGYVADIYYHLGICWANLNMQSKAIPPLSQAISLSYNQPAYIHQRAKCYLLTNQNQKALQDYNEVIKMQNKNSHAYFGRAFAYKALKNYQLAAQDFQKAKQLDPYNPRLIINPKKIYQVKYIKLCQPGEQMR